jgi:hypothetical protein
MMAIARLCWMFCFQLGKIKGIIGPNYILNDNPIFRKCYKLSEVERVLV